MLKKSRYANLLIDVVTRLSSARTAEERWSRICDIAGGIGAIGVNAGEFSRTTRQPSWTTYNMDPDWLEEYAGARLHEIDPVLSAVIKGRVPRLIVPGMGIPGVAPDPRKRQFDAGLKRYNYNYCVCLTKVSGDSEKAIALVSDRDPTDLFGSGTQRAFQAVSTVLLDFLVPPNDKDAPAVIGSARGELYGPERDMLSLMAHGMTVAEAADRLNIDPVLAQTLLQQSAEKLGAVDGDQALAMAMARGLLSL